MSSILYGCKEFVDINQTTLLIALVEWKIANQIDFIKLWYGDTTFNSVPFIEWVAGLEKKNKRIKQSAAMLYCG
nr:hypothetical protein [Entomoplasma sp. MP1]